MIGIYKIQNKINNKIYIGQSKDIKRRWEEHKSCSKPNAILTIAFQKYGIENFSFEIIEECKIEELNDKEIYWIKYYNSFEDGYNLTRGGNSGFYYDIYAIFELFQKNNNITQTAKEIGCHPNTVRNIIHSFNINFIKENQPKCVLKIEPQTLNILKEYPSIHEAARLNNIQDSLLTSVLQGKRKSCGGYLWCLKEKYNSNDFQPIKLKQWKRKVAQINKETKEIIKIFNSISEAAISLGKASSAGTCITAVCKGRKKSAYGYEWKYID